MRSSKIYGATRGSKKSSPGVHTNVFNVNISRNTIPETAPSTTSDTWDETVRQAYRVCKERVRMCQCTTKKKATRRKRVEEHRRWLQERLEKEDEWRHELAHSIASLSYFDANQDERSSVARSMSFFDTMDDYWSDEEIEEITNDILFRNDDMMEDIMDFRHHDGKSINPHAVLHRPSSVLCAEGFTEIPKDCVGYPGLLTSDEYDAIMELKYRFDQQKDPMYWDMVRHFSDLKPEVFALCRFCRGRNFNAAEVIQMMSEHIKQWRYASVNNFFPGTYVFETAQYLREKISDIGLTCRLNDLSSTVVLERPLDDKLVKRWQLACEEDIAHVVVSVPIAVRHVESLMRAKFYLRDYEFSIILRTYVCLIILPYSQYTLKSRII